MELETSDSSGLTYDKDLWHKSHNSTIIWSCENPRSCAYVCGAEAVGTVLQTGKNNSKYRRVYNRIPVKGEVGIKLYEQ